jgi:RNA polymerase sigma factor (sigma-70 family)
MTEQQAFADCVAREVPFLIQYVRRLVRGNQIAEDIVQQTILKALMNADQFRFESSLTTWLTSIAVNEVRQAYRCCWKRRAVPLITEAVDVDRCQCFEFPHSSYEVKERELLVRAAVARLPQMYRSVVELCEFQQITMKEAARKLGLTMPAIKTRRRRARQKLRPLVATLRLNCNSLRV